MFVSFQESVCLDSKLEIHYRPAIVLYFLKMFLSKQEHRPWPSVWQRHPPQLRGVHRGLHKNINQSRYIALEKGPKFSTFLKKHCKQGGYIPAPSHLRTEYLPELYPQYVQDIKEAVEGRTFMSSLMRQSMTLEDVHSSSYTSKLYHCVPSCHVLSQQQWG